MALSQALMGSIAPNTVTDYANDAMKQRATQQFMASQVMNQQIQAQSAQEELQGKRRAMAVSILNGIDQEQDPVKQAALYSTLKPMAERYDPTLKLPDAYDSSLGKALVASQITPQNQAEMGLKKQAMAIEQQKADQGNFEPVKDYLGNVTGFVNKKTGGLMDNPKSAATTPAASDGTPLTGEDFIKTLSPSQASVIKRIGEGRGKLSEFRGKMRDVVASQLGQAYPDYDEHAYDTLTEFNKGKLGNTVRSLSVANDHLDTLSQYATALQNGDTKLLNSLKNSFSSQVGTAAPANFNAVKQIVADEVVKAVVGSGGAVSDREDLKSQLSAASSPEQLAGVIHSYKELMKGQLSGLKQQYETIPESARKNNTFESRLTERTRKEILGDSKTGQTSSGMPPEAKQAPDGNYYLPDPNRPGKYLMVQP